MIKNLLFFNNGVMNGGVIILLVNNYSILIFEDVIMELNRV